ncbi:hypothetical protein TrispH2_001584 [Trichoplax sp. H2]|nr:hypothetical protein TrispH2_001584 [Trichoplax sp. H2]|eukprot:RDD47034.1 hypothetical protein TrispH2_001584 [Trichoplax sp. H2]
MDEDDYVTLLMADEEYCTSCINRVKECLKMITRTICYLVLIALYTVVPVFYAMQGFYLFANGCRPQYFYFGPATTLLMSLYLFSCSMILVTFFVLWRLYPSSVNLRHNIANILAFFIVIGVGFELVLIYFLLFQFRSNVTFVHITFCNTTFLSVATSPFLCLLYMIINSIFLPIFRFNILE